MGGQALGTSVSLVLLVFLLMTEFIDLFPLNDIRGKTKASRKGALLFRGIPLALIALLTALGNHAAVWSAACIAFIFVAGHVFVWWIPYLFGSSDAYKKRMSRLFGHTHRILPRIRDHVVPDTAHTIVTGLAVVMLSAVVAASAGSRPAEEPAVAAPEVKPPAIEYAFTQANQHPEKLLTDLIGSAKKTLDIAIESLTHDDIIKAILEARNRGVAVRLITDRNENAGSSGQADKLRTLLEAQIPVKEQTHKGLMDMKLALVDGLAAATGSFNYTVNAATNNDGLLVIIRDADVVRAWTAEFDIMWNDTQNFRSLVIGVVPKK